MFTSVIAEASSGHSQGSAIAMLVLDADGCVCVVTVGMPARAGGGGVGTVVNSRPILVGARGAASIAMRQIGAFD